MKTITKRVALLFTCAVLSVLAPKTVMADANFTYFLNDGYSDLNLELRNIPSLLAPQVTDSYVQVYEGLKKCSAFDRHERIRTEILTRMRENRVIIAGDEKAFAWTCERYDLLQSKPITWKMTVPVGNESLCFAMMDDMMKDRGGAARISWVDFVDVAKKRPDLVLTPLSFQEPGTVKVSVLEFLLDRFTDMAQSDTENLAHRCLRVKRSH